LRIFDTPDFFPPLPALPLFPCPMATLGEYSLPALHSSSDTDTPPLDEKSASVDIPCDEEAALDSDKYFSGVNGEPVITNGGDVSRYLVDLRDEEDPPFTFRSAVLGTVIGGLGAALYQVRHVQS
jgi:hypothetical protein